MGKNKNILVTGAYGFIGRSLSENLSKKYNVIGIDTHNSNLEPGYHHIVADIVDVSAIQKICETYKPSIVIHCAGIAHQTLAKSSRETYFKVNSDATEHLAEIALKSNPDVHFIYLSSMSVYGETHFGAPYKETDECDPSSDYAHSKLDAEHRLKRLFNNNAFQNLDILRLAPVYDINWSVNLEKRVFAPKRVAYVRYGSGSQTISALSLKNLVDFVLYLIDKREKNDAKPFYNIVNVADDRNYSFNEIISCFRRSSVQPDRPVIRVPVIGVWLFTRIGGLLYRSKKKWIYSCYSKVVFSLTVDASKMYKTGYKAQSNLVRVYN